jgi:hypothetical protein
VDKLLAAHYAIDEEKFAYEWNCIFPESAAQKAERMTKKAEGIVLIVDSGIMSRESGLKELQDYGCVSKDAKVGDNPNENQTKTGVTTDAKKDSY